MATHLNFGKYKGFTMEELAQAGKYGRSYLHWCATNLQNPAMRRAADTALRNFTQPKEELVYRLIAVEPDYRGWEYDEIEREVANELGQAEDDARYDARLSAASNQLRADLQAMKCSDQVINFVMSSLDADAIFARIKFSSIEKQAAFTAAWNKYEDSLPLPGQC